jgi:hypothetical protein
VYAFHHRVRLPAICLLMRLLCRTCLPANAADVGPRHLLNIKSTVERRENMVS